MTKYVFLSLVVLIGCYSGKEVVMPFKNAGVDGSELLPIQKVTDSFTLRIWINNSTSISRVITISQEPFFNTYQGHLVEFGNLINDKKIRGFYKKQKIEPKSGFSNFIKSITSLSIYSLNDKEDLPIFRTHDPFSAYIVEIKNKEQINSFRFTTYYPIDRHTNDLYERIEKLIFDEFDLKKYFRFQK